jgi:hypothetical protein
MLGIKGTTLFMLIGWELNYLALHHFPRSGFWGFVGLARAIVSN